MNSHSSAPPGAFGASTGRGARGWGGLGSDLAANPGWPCQGRAGPGPGLEGLTGTWEWYTMDWEWFHPSDVTTGMVRAWCHLWYLPSLKERSCDCPRGRVFTRRSWNHGIS